jgi:hypothetical protein
MLLLLQGSTGLNMLQLMEYKLLKRFAPHSHSSIILLKVKGKSIPAKGRGGP